MLRKSRTLRAAVCLGLFAILLSGVLLRAQNENATGTVLGHVKDASGASLPGAKVILRNEQTGIVTSFTTGPTGDYIFVNRIPDIYDVSVEAKGFRTATTTGLVLQVDQTLRQDFTLQVGEETQRVTVSASAPMLQTDNATIGTVVDQRAIQSLPLNGRDYVTLVSINAGATHSPPGGIQSTIFDPHGLDANFQMTAVDGQIPDATSYMVDGITDTDFFFSKPISLISADSIQEFKLQNGLYSAAFGTGSAQVNVALKSGTNQLHGSAYDYWENEALQPASPVVAALNAKNHSNFPAKPTFNQNQFGFTLGGPLVLPKIYNGRDRTFWFAGYEGGRNVQGTNVPSFYQVPTTAEKQGDFSDWPYPIYNPATTGLAPKTTTNPAGRMTFPNNTIPSGMISPIAQKWLADFPTPNVSCQLPCQNLTGVLNTAIISDTVNGRVDHKITDRDRLTGTVIVSRDVPTSPSLFPESASLSFQRTRMAGLEYDRDLSPTAINSFRAGYNREFFHEGASTSYGPNLSSLLGFNNTTPLPAFYGLPGLDLADGYGGPGNNNNGYTQKENIFQYVDNLTLIHGRHTLTAGADIRRFQLQDEDGFSADGVINFTGAYTASSPTLAGQAGASNGNAIADLLLGYPFSVPFKPAPLATDIYNLRATDWNFFAQDDFRVTPRLTLNLGLRWEIPESPHSITSDGALFNPATQGGGLTWASRSFVAPLASAPKASVYYQCCVSNELVTTPMRDFAPRIGLAFRPLPGSDKLVMRAGYGIFYDIFTEYYQGTNYNSNLLALLQPNPGYPAATGAESASPLGTLWLPPISVTPSTVPPAYAYTLQSIMPGNKTPYNQQWSFDAQYAFTENLMLDVGYVGAHALDMPVKLYFNQAVPPKVAGDPCNSVTDRSQAKAACLADPNFQPIDTRVPYTNFSAASFFQEADVLYSNYNALQVTLKKRFSQGLQLTAAYTWSHSLDTGSSLAGFGGTSSHVQNDHDLAAEYGSSEFDQPQRLVLSYLYDVPVGRGRKFNAGAANRILGGWKASGILTFSSGVPFTAYCCPRGSPVDQEGTTRGDDFRPNLAGNPNAGAQSVIQWFNPAAYASPAAGTFGNVGRDTLRTPGIHEGDLSFMKDFHITERHMLEYRLDIFNVFSSRYAVIHLPDNRLSDSPANCTAGPAGNCNFGSLVPLNGLGALNLWNPRVLQMSLRYSF
ncbi:MAG: TonB-dependent receptor domain-containing protein [Terriglobia bacterium]